MSTERMEPGEEEQTTTNADVIPEGVGEMDPLTSEPKIEREHTAQAGQTAGAKPMPEYNPRIDPAMDEGMPEEPEVPPYDKMNEEMKNMPPEAQAEAAAFAADQVLGLYGEGKRMLGNKMVLFSERDLKKLHQKGDINLDLPIPYSKSGLGETPRFTPARAAIHAYNEMARDSFGLRPAFAEKARPVLIDEFKRRGVGLTPMMYLGILVAGDLRKDFIMYAKLKSQNDEILETLKEATKYYQRNGQPQPGHENIVQPVTPVTPPPPQETQVPEPIVTPAAETVTMQQPVKEIHIPPYSAFKQPQQRKVRKKRTRKPGSKPRPYKRKISKD